MLTNEQLFNQLIGAYGSDEKHTAPASLQKLRSIGYNGVKYGDIQTQADWTALTLQFMLINLETGRVQNVFKAHNFGETFGLEQGGIAQKILVDPVSTINAPWADVKDGETVDQFPYLDVPVNERFWKQNFDYAAACSIRDDFFRKTVMANEYGMSLLVSGKMKSLDNSFSEQQYWNVISRLNEILNSEKYPLKETQKVQLDITGENGTNDEIINFAKAIRNVIQAMCDLSPATDAFNAYSFRTTQDKARLHLIVRPGYKTALEFTLPQINHYPSDPLGNLDIIEVENFGGLKYYKDSNHNTEIYPAVDKFGRKIKDKWSTSPDGKTIDDSVSDVFTVDPNENVIAMLLDTGIIFDCEQNPYTVEATRNSWGKYTTYLAGRPNELLGVDPAHNGVVFYKKGNP